MRMRDLNNAHANLGKKTLILCIWKQLQVSVGIQSTFGQLESNTDDNRSNFITASKQSLACHRRYPMNSMAHFQKRLSLQATY